LWCELETLAAKHRRPGGLPLAFAVGTTFRMNSTGELPLTDQIAVVTGSSSGVGRAIALALAAQGADVLIHARKNATGAAQVSQEIEQLGRKSEVICCDIGDHGTHAGLVENAWSWQKRVDIWVNNAGADILTGPAAEWPFEQKLATLWQVDVVSTIRLSRMVGPRMRQRGSGVILNMGWSQAEIGMGGDAGELFGPIKAAIMAYSRSLAKTLAPEVRVNCLAPGWIKTKWGETAPEYWQQRAEREALLNRWGTPEDVAQAACYLVSPAASFITGHTLPVDGGLRTGSE
jgi:3-oxoacyl-[acyl-carrier protein] reductase